MVAQVAFLVVVVGGGSGLYQDDVLLLELVANLLQGLVYLGGAYARPVLLVPEVQNDAVGEAILQRDLARARGVGSDMLYGVHVGTGVIALDNRVRGGQLVYAVLVRPHARREVLPGIEHQHLGRVDAGESDHVPVDGHREVNEPAHAFSLPLTIACKTSKWYLSALPAFSGDPSASASSSGRCISASSSRSMSILRAVTTTRASTLNVFQRSRSTLFSAASTIRR